jgi:hypothetical protein
MRKDKPGYAIDAALVYRNVGLLMFVSLPLLRLMLRRILHKSDGIASYPDLFSPDWYTVNFGM